MLKSVSFGKFDLEVVSSMNETSEVPDQDQPFRILIIGDFSGRASRGLFEPEAALNKRRLLQVDRDNIDEVMAELGVEIHIPIYGEDEPPTVIQFKGMDDFHPDQLFAHLELFNVISEKRKIAASPSFLANIRGNVPSSVSTAVQGVDEDTIKHIVSQTSGSLLDQVLEETAGEGPRKDSIAKPTEWDSFLDNVVQPHLVGDTGREQAQLLAELDDTTGELMRAILHYPDFQDAESAWRGVGFMVSRLDTGEDLKLYLLDITKAELAEDLKSEDLRSSGFYRLLVELATNSPGSDPWGLVAGNYLFDGSIEDVDTLGRIAKIAAVARAPFVAGADISMIGSESLAGCPDTGKWSHGNAAWNMLRRIPEAEYLGLALPGFLLRLPYGANTDPTELFYFEEMSPIPVHDQYLWGNPAFACSFLIGEAFSESGWGFRPGTIQDIENIPLHIYKVQGESHVCPCTGTVFAVDTVEALMDMGLMPLITFKSRDMIRLARFQSVSEPSACLAGRWDIS